MKTIGIIGGMSAESTAHYYALINQLVRKRMGGLHSAETIIWSVDFAEIAEMQARDQWDLAGKKLRQIAYRLDRIGADVILLATNTMHKVADDIVELIDVPFIHIADATAERIKAAGFKRPGLMATAYTMEQDFYKGRLRDRHGLDVIIPIDIDRAETHRIIYDELCKGIVAEQSRASFVGIAQRLKAAGADCLILGCTEVGMLLNSTNVSLPVYDTTRIHAEAAVDFALSEIALKAAE
jgi:aspartate racemase